MAQNLTSDGAVEMDVGYTPTSSLDIVTVAYINAVIGAEALHPGPFALTVTVDLSGHAALAWTSSPNALNYQVYRDAAAYGSVTTGAATAFDGGSLTPGLTAEFSVRAWVSDTNDYYNTAIMPLVRQNVVLQSITWSVFNTPALTPSTGPVATFSRAGDCTYFFGTEMRYEESGQPCFNNTNVIRNYASAPDTPATQTVDLQCGMYVVQVFGGTGTLTCTGNGATGTAVVDAPITIDVYANSSDKAAVVFSLGGSGATAIMISPGTVTPGYTNAVTRTPSPGQRSGLRIFAGETDVTSAATGMKGYNNFNPPTGSLASNNRTSVLADRIQDTSRSYFAWEATSTSAHGMSTSKTFSAGAYCAEWLVGKSSTRGYAFGIVDAGGSVYGFVDPSAGTVTLPALTVSSPAAINFATSALGDVGSMFKFRTTFNISASSTACTIVGRLLISLSANTMADMVYGGQLLGVSHGQLGVKRGTPQAWLAQHPPQLGLSRPDEIVTQTLTTEFNTSATTIFWRGQVHEEATGVRTILSGNLWSLAVNASDKVALAISSTTLTHANVIERGSDFSVACRIQSGAHYLQVDRGTPVSSGASAAPGSTTTLKHGRNSADGEFLNGFVSYFQMVPTAYTDAQITQWTSDQGTGVSGSVPAVVRCKFNGTQAGHGLAILNQSINGSAGIAKSQLSAMIARGMTAIPNVIIGYPWKNFEPTTRDVYTWTDFDGIMSVAEAASKNVWVQIYTTNYHVQNKTVPAYIAATDIIWDAVDTREETKMENESVMTDHIRATAAFATRYRNRARFMGFQHQETSQTRITQATLPSLFSQYRRWITTLSASFPDLSFGGKYNSTRRDLIELNANAMITARCGNFGWPDSRLPELTNPNVSGFWQGYLVARTASFNTKMIMAPSVQTGLIDATLATGRTIRNTLISAMKAHVIFWNPVHPTTGNSYFEEVVRVICQESATTNTADPFLT